MKLYNKIQELVNESESLKQKNNEVLGLAKKRIKRSIVNTKAKENLESLKNTFQGYLNGELVEMPIIVKKNVKGLFNKQALTKEIHNELLSQFDKQAITDALKQELKTEIKTELSNLLSDKELQSELQQAKTEIISQTTSDTINALTSKILEILKKYFKENIDSALQEAEKLKVLRLTELKALCYLQVTLESLKVQSLQNALMLEADILNNKVKNRKRDRLQFEA